MGCFWSCVEGDADRCIYCRRKAVEDLIIINDNQCQLCLARRSRTSFEVRPRELLRPLFGEFRCSCGRTWASRRSYRRRYQICRECRKNVYSHTQRALRPSDMSRDRGNKQDHPKDLCQMCIELGYYCGKLRYINV